MMFRNVGDKGKDLSERLKDLYFFPCEGWKAGKREEEEVVCFVFYFSFFCANVLRACKDKENVQIQI